MAEKEGGFGWCVTAASFLVHFIVGGIGYSASVLHHIFSSYYDRNHFDTSWITALILGLTALGGIPSVLFMYQFGPRVTVIAGGILASAGLLLSIWCQHLYEVYFTVGGMLGLGLGLTLTPAITILEAYFYTRHQLAASIAGSGTALGVFAFPLAIYHLEDTLAWKGMALVLAGVTLNLCLCGACFVPVKHGPKHRSDLIKLFNPAILRSAAFDAVITSNMLWGIGIAIIYTYLPAYSQSTGQLVADSFMLLGVAGVSAFSSRSMFQVFSHSAKLDNISMFLCSSCISVILTGLHPQLFAHFAGQIGYAIMLGLHTGFWGTFIAFITDEYIGAEYMCPGKGFVMLTIGAGFLAGAPLGGWILDTTEDFEIVFYLAGTCLVVSSLLMMIVSFKKCYYRPPQDSSDAISQTSAESGNKLHYEENPNPKEIEELMVGAAISSV